MRRVVFDTTVLISAFLRPGGLSDELLVLAADGDFELLLAEAIITETRNKLLTSKRLRGRYAYSDGVVARFCRALGLLAQIVTDLPSLTGVDYNACGGQVLKVDGPGAPHQRGPDCPGEIEKRYAS